ncbi:MAG: hypothetical protein ACREH5_06365, partial [Candidatus Omnitrophota bacterium]
LYLDLTGRQESRMQYSEAAKEKFLKETGLETEGEIVMFLNGVRDARAGKLDQAGGYTVKDGYLFPTDQVGKMADKSRISDTNYKLGLALEHTTLFKDGKFAGLKTGEAKVELVGQAKTENYTSLLQIFARPNARIMGMSATASGRTSLIRAGIGSDLRVVTSSKYDAGAFKSKQSFDLDRIRQINVEKVTDLESLREQDAQVGRFVENILDTIRSGESSVLIASMDTQVRSRLNQIFEKLGYKEQLVSLGAQDADQINEAATKAGPGAEAYDGKAKIHIVGEQGFTGVDWRGKLDLHILGAENMPETLLAQLTYRTGRTTGSRDARFVDLESGRFKSERHLYYDRAKLDQMAAELGKNTLFKDSLTGVFKLQGDKLGLELMEKLTGDKLNREEKLHLMLKMKDAMERSEGIEFALSDTLKGRMVIQVLRGWIDNKRADIQSGKLNWFQRKIAEKDLKALEAKFEDVINQESRGSGLAGSGELDTADARGRNLFNASRNDAIKIFTELLQGRNKNGFSVVSLWGRILNIVTFGVLGKGMLSSLGGMRDAARSLVRDYVKLNYDLVPAVADDASFAQAKTIEEVVGVAKRLAREMLPKAEGAREKNVEVLERTVTAALDRIGVTEQAKRDEILKTLGENKGFLETAKDPVTGKEAVTDRLTKAGRVLLGMYANIGNAPSDDNYGEMAAYVQGLAAARGQSIAASDPLQVSLFLMQSGLVSEYDDVAKGMKALRDIARVTDQLGTQLPAVTPAIGALRAVMVDNTHTDRAIHAFMTQTYGLKEKAVATAMAAAYVSVADKAQSGTGALDTQKRSAGEIVKLARYQELRNTGISPKEALATIKAEGLDKKEMLKDGSRTETAEEYANRATQAMMFRSGSSIKAFDRWMNMQRLGMKDQKKSG